MHKTKTLVTPLKNRTKTTSPSPTPKKNNNKSKDRLSPHSPRSTRIHTLQAKASPQLHKKNKQSTDLESPLRIPLAPKNQPKDKGYETPKFKCEVDPPKTYKHPNIQNFFSFGQKEAQKVLSFKYRREKEKQNMGGQRSRKDARLR